MLLLLLLLIMMTTIMMYTTTFTTATVIEKLLMMMTVMKELFMKVFVLSLSLVLAFHLVLKHPPLSNERFLIQRARNQYLPISVLEVIDNVHCLQNLCLILCFKYPDCNAFNFRIILSAGCRCELQVIVSVYYSNDSYIPEAGSSHWETDLLVA